MQEYNYITELSCLTVTIANGYKVGSWTWESLEVLEARHSKSMSLQGWCLMEKGKEFLSRPSLWCHPWTCLVCTLIIPVCLHLHSGLLCGKARSSFSILDLGPTLNPG